MKIPTHDEVWCRHRAAHSRCISTWLQQHAHRMDDGRSEALGKTEWRAGVTASSSVSGITSNAVRQQTQPRHLRCTTEKDGRVSLIQHLMGEPCPGQTDLLESDPPSCSPRTGQLQVRHSAVVDDGLGALVLLKVFPLSLVFYFSVPQSFTVEDLKHTDLPPYCC